MKIQSFEACVAAGYGTSLTHPETCRIPGKIFTNESQQNDTEAENSLSASSTALINTYKNLTYFVDGQKLQMTEGQGELFSPTAKKGVLFTIIEPTLSVQENNASSLFFLVQRKDFPNQIRYYLGAAKSLNFTFVGLNLIFVGISVSSSTLTYDNGTTTLRYTGTKDAQMIKQFTFADDIIKEIQ